VGVLWRNRPVVGAIFTPSGPAATPVTFHARAGGGAAMGGTPMRVADEPEPTKARLSGLPGHYWQDMRFRRRKPPGLGETRTLGSTALELALIGAGVLQYGIFWSPKIWDVAAGVLLVREAGGEIACRDPVPATGDGCAPSRHRNQPSPTRGRERSSPAPHRRQADRRGRGRPPQLLSPIGPLWRRLRASE
jgi:fructose-1,6-bisphosphatase/inositol monophosphatase family enzyme